ncbi:MAG: cation transporter [Bacteroidia bacterium]|nr:cation transporter [Bacteroidia bacterium]
MAGNSTRVVIVAFIMNLGIAASKFGGFFFTHSTSMLAEALHSLADTSNQIFLFLGLRKSTKSASSLHQFGYGMEQYIWSFMVAILIFTLGGLFSLYEGIHKLMNPEGIENPVINLVILGIGVCLEGYSSFVATRELKKTMGNKSLKDYVMGSKNQILVTVLFEDYAALVGLVIALAGNVTYMVTGNPLVDPVATILIGLLLFVIAVFLYRKAKSMLVGEAASPEDQEKIRKVFEKNPNVLEIREILTMHLSAEQILLNAHIKFRNGLTLEELEDVIDEMEDEIAEEVPGIYKIFIEAHQKDTVGDYKKSVLSKTINKEH